MSYSSSYGNTNSFTSSTSRSQRRIERFDMDRRRRDNETCWTFKVKMIVGITFTVILGIGVLLMLILVPLSVQYVEHDQYAFKKNKVTNNVDTDTVYEKGRYFWGVGYEAVSFPRTAQHVVYKDGDHGALLVFTDGGLEFKIECAFQYFLIKDGLPTLFKQFSSTFNTQIVNVGRTSLKNTAPNFPVDDFVKNRKNVQHQMYLQLKSELNKLCGSTMCVDVPEHKFQLRRIIFPPQIANKYLDVAVQTQTNIEKQEKQVADLTRKETEKLVEVVKANITVVTQESIAQSNRIVEEANANSFKVKQIAIGQGINTALTAIGIDSSQSELSNKFIRLMSILDSNTPKLLSGISNTIIQL